MSNATPRAGFTLIEVMIAVVLIAVVTGIVYASLSAVVSSTENGRVAAEEMRLRQFLTRNIEWNISQMYPDWQPGASLRDPERAEDALARSEIIDNTSDSPFDDEDLLNASYWLEGTDDSGPGGPADRISFSTTARLSGGGALPGVIKQVTYEIVDQSEADETLMFLDDDTRVLMLQCTEVPIFDLATLNEEDIDDFGSREDFLEEQDFDTPGWSVPIASMDIQYFDGEDWIDEWDSVAEGRLPWAIHFRLNFARPEGEQEIGYDAIDDPDLSLIVSLPGGLGVTEPPVEPVYRAEAGRDGVGGGGGRGSPGPNDPNEPDPDNDNGQN